MGCHAKHGIGEQNFTSIKAAEPFIYGG